MVFCVGRTANEIVLHLQTLWIMHMVSRFTEHCLLLTCISMALTSFFDHTISSMLVLAVCSAALLIAQ